jgi:hypothetical protein
MVSHSFIWSILTVKEVFVNMILLFQYILSQEKWWQRKGSFASPTKHFYHSVL